MGNIQQSHKGLFVFALAMGASLISMTGTQMTQFAVIIWAWQSTGSTVAAGLITVASFATTVTVSVLAGAIVDRWHRKFVIICTDILGTFATAIALLLYLSHNLQIWHLAVLGVILGIQDAFQFPAYLACVTEMVSENQQSRANAMYQLSWSISGVVAAALAGVLFAAVGLAGILFIDLVTFSVIIVTIALLRIPQPERIEDEQSSLGQDILAGFLYLLNKPNLLWTVLIFTSINVAYGAYLGVFRPMILALTSNSEVILGVVLATVGIGNVVGGIVMGAWPGPKNRIPLMLVGWSLMSAFAFVIAGFGRSLAIWVIAAFLQGFFNDIALPLTFAIWQSKIESSVQGRVMGIIRLVFQGSIPLSMFAVTLLSDHVIEPAMQTGKPLASLFGGLLGTGNGAAMSLILISVGAIFGVIVPLLGFAIPTVRRADYKEAKEAMLVD